MNAGPTVEARMGDGRRELVDVLLDARLLLARPDNNFDWSGWEDADAAFAEVDVLLGGVCSGRLPGWASISILFAPTGPLQETALSSGWGDEFVELARRCDAAVQAVYGQLAG